MSKYTDIVKQIEELQQKAEELRKKEVAEVIAKVHALLAEYNMTVDDLLPQSRRAAISKTTGKKLPVKYINKDGETWSGQGRAPKWLADAQAEGKDINEFRVRTPGQPA